MSYVDEIKVVIQGLTRKDEIVAEREREANISAWIRKLREYRLEDPAGMIEFFKNIGNGEYEHFSPEERGRFKTMVAAAELVVQGIEPTGGIDWFWGEIEHFIAL